MDLSRLRRRYAGYDWQPVTIGESGAAVYRLSQRFVRRYTGSGDVGSGIDPARLDFYRLLDEFL